MSHEGSVGSWTGGGERARHIVVDRGLKRRTLRREETEGRTDRVVRVRLLQKVCCTSVRQRPRSLGAALGGSMVGPDRLNVPAIDNSSH